MLWKYPVRNPVGDQIHRAVVCGLKHIGCDLGCVVRVETPV